jgi:hypothetical protein
MLIFRAVCDWVLRFNLNRCDWREKPASRGSRDEVPQPVSMNPAEALIGSVANGVPFPFPSVSGDRVAIMKLAEFFIGGAWPRPNRKKSVTGGVETLDGSDTEASSLGIRRAVGVEWNIERLR